MRANLDALQGLVFSERLARALAADTDRATALALVEDWSGLAVAERRHLRDVALAARPALAGRLEEVFSPEAIVRELAPVLEETLAGIPGDAGAAR
jgi:adenylosuccinate lyase